MRARFAISFLIVMALVWGVLIGWGYLVRRANAQLRDAIPGMVEDAVQSSVGASEVGRRSSAYQLGTNRQVTIENPDGNIEVTAGGSQVAVEGVIRATGSSHAAAAAKAPSIRVVERRASDGALTIAVVRDKAVHSVWMDLKVQGPPDAPLRLEGGSGNMQVAGLRAPVAIEVGSGHIVVRSLAGRADLSTGSGNVTADGVLGGIRAESGSGDVHLSAITGETTAHSDSGNVTATINTSPRIVAGSGSGNVTVAVQQPFRGTLEARADSGNVTISLPAGSDCRVRAATASGNVTSTLPLAEASRSQSEMSGRLGSGEGSVIAESGSGNVDLRVAQ